MRLIWIPSLNHSLLSHNHLNFFCHTAFIMAYVCPYFQVSIDNVFYKSVEFYNVVCLLDSLRVVPQWLRVNSVFEDHQSKCDNCVTLDTKLDYSLARNVLEVLDWRIYLLIYFNWVSVYLKRVPGYLWGLGKSSCREKPPAELSYYLFEITAF